MKYEVLTDLSPEDVLRKAEEFYQANTGLSVTSRDDGRIELSGKIGEATISARRDHGGYTTVYAETDRGAGFDVTDQTLRFLYSLPHI